MEEKWKIVVTTTVGLVLWLINDQQDFAVDYFRDVGSANKPAFYIVRQVFVRYLSATNWLIWFHIFFNFIFEREYIQILSIGVHFILFFFGKKFLGNFLYC